MSGGRLVVLDRQGRDVKQYPLPDGLVTLGSDPACDIRVMLPSVRAHHATVDVHANQTVVRNIGDGDTLVNGDCVSIAALRHMDIITLGDRSLRWEYSNPHVRRHQLVEPVVFLSRVSSRGDSRRARRATAAGGARDRALHLHHRASMPASTGGKQVAIVQPQRRDNNEQNEKTSRPQPQSTKRPRSNADISMEEDKSKRKSTTRISPKNVSMQTKASLWIESRKTSPRKSTKAQSLSPQKSANTQDSIKGHSNTRSPGARKRVKTRSLSPPKSAKTRSPSPRKSTKTQTFPTRPKIGVRRVVSAKKSTPLRMVVLKKAQSAQKYRVMKIEAPVKIDHTKQAAIMLMTGHTLKQKQPTPKSKTPSYVVKKPSPVRKTPRGRPAKRSKEILTPIGVTPKRATTYQQTTTRKSNRNSRNQSVSVLEITDSEAQISTSRVSNASQKSGRKSSQKSPRLPSPKKSALKDPKKNNRKTESIKFDLSNLENMPRSNDVLMVSNAPQQSEGDESMSEEEEFTLRYSDNSSSPSPRKSIHSRSSRILEKTIGSPMTLSPSRSQTSESMNRGRKSLRGSIIVQKALENDSERQSTQSFDQSAASAASAFRTHTLSPRQSQNMESYSIVDLVSIDSNDSPRTSIYNSAESNATFDVINSTGRKTRSTIDPTLLGSSTPYLGKKGRQTVGSQDSTLANESQLSPEISQLSARPNRYSILTRQTKSLSTPENTQKHISVNSTRISRVSRSRSRLNDSDLLLVDGDESNVSPKTSKRGSRASKSILSESFIHNDQNSVTSVSDDVSQDGVTTPENRQSPQDIGTPILSIQSLLDSSQNSFTSLKSKKQLSQRKTIGTISGNKKGHASFKSNSLNFSSRRTTSRLRQNSSEGSDKTDEGAPQPDNEETVTPKSAVKLVHEGVKNKHSTAKKPQSKRSIIDDLNQSDIVKQLFNSPVKRKLSQSMTEFSRKQLFEDDDDEVVLTKRPTRNTIAVTGRSPEYSILDQTEPISPEVFVSPMNTPSVSPNLEGIKRLFAKSTPQNDLSNVKGVKSLFRTPRVRRSGRNDLTNVSGVKAVFAKSPRNRLSDVAVRDLFVEEPRNDIRRVSGVKSLFQTKKKDKDPKNDLTDVRGVKSLFKNSPANDLRNVSGAKKILRKTSPRNDLTDVRGVKEMFRETKKQTDDCDVSGIEELFDESHRDTDSVFDQLIGKPPIRAVYSTTFSGRGIQKAKNRKGKTLHASIDVITNNVEEWLEKELHKRLQKDSSKSSVTRELKKLATTTVEGSTPIRNSRVRDSTVWKVTQGEYERKKSASEIYSAKKLPIKKRSLIETSTERSLKEDGQKSILPIKKRVVVHSTPVKGRVNVTMNASELGRVSPIALDCARPEAPEIITVQILDLPQLIPITEKRKTGNLSKTRETKANMSPKKTRAKAKASPPKVKVTRSRKEKSIKQEKTENQPLDTVKTSPVKPLSRATRNKKDAKLDGIMESEKSNGPKKTTRRQKVSERQEPKMTPKRTTRAKVQKASVIVSKPSPQLKPKSVRNIEKELVDELKTTKEVTQKTRTSRKPANKTDTESEPQARKRQTRAAAAAKTPTKAQKSDKSKNQTHKLADKSPPVKRGRKTNAKAKEQENKPSPMKVVKTRGKSKVTETNSPKGIRNEVQKTAQTKSKAKIHKNIENPVEDQVLLKSTRGRGKKSEAQTSVETGATRQTRRTKIDNTLIPTEKGRKRKITTEDTIASKARRGRKNTVETTVTATANGRQKRSALKHNQVNVSITTQELEVRKITRVVRSRKVGEEVTSLQKPVEQVTRGRKRTTTVENAPDNKRTKKSKPDMSPIKEIVKKPPARKNANTVKATVSVVASPLKARGRSTRGKTNEAGVSKKPVGRAPRR